MAQLAQTKVDIIEPHLKAIYDIINLKNSNYIDFLIAAAWRTIKVYVKGADKNKAKAQLDIILEPLFRDAQSKTEISLIDSFIDKKDHIANEIEDILKIYKDKIGFNILKGRVENIFGTKYSSFLDTLNK